jgi:2'-hydroxyisoflavone reductase
MNILILGGTLFLGRALAEAALARGHGVTLFNRGRHAAEPIAGAESLIGDRDGALDVLRGRSWNAVVDTSGYVPRLVRSSAELLVDAVERYVFVSSVSAYADFGKPVHESAPLATMADARVEEVTGASYGPLKALSERALAEAFRGRTLIVRPGLIVGPHDPTARFSYWTDRVARGGEVLAPDHPDAAVQFIDVRDLAEWMVRMIENEEVGVFNATGPTMRFGKMLETMRDAIPTDARFTWVSEAFLAAHGVLAWSHLPLWIPNARESHRYFNRIDIERALAAGLAFRPLAETVRNTFAWQRANAGRPLPEKPGVPTPDLTLRPERERELLQDWHRAGAAA